MKTKEIDTDTLCEKRLCFVASSGGHIEEISQLSALAERYPSILITEQETYPVETFGDKVYFIKKMNRKEWASWKSFFKSFRLARRLYREHHITHLITTGAMCSYPFCLVAHLMGIKLVYIESFARVASPSLTGRLVYPFADLFVVQWPELTKYYSHAVYGGGIF